MSDPGASRCPECGEKDSYVIETRERERDGDIWRRRGCHCGARWTTIETSRAIANAGRAAIAASAGVERGLGTISAALRLLRTGNAVGN